MKRMTKQRRIIATAFSVTAVFVVLGVGLLAIRNSAEAHAVIRWGYYVNYDENSRRTLDANMHQLDYVSPYWYHITPNGSLKAFDQPDVARQLKANNVKVIPLVQNEARWDDFTKTIETPEKRDAIVASLLNLVQSKGYDGIQIDFEAVNAVDVHLLTDFMKRLHAQFNPRGLLVSQAIISRTSDTPTTWGGAYDYRELPKYNDFIVIMAYDYGYAGRPTPSAVAPIWWVEQVANYARSRIPASQLILGVPFYGYNWNVTKGPPATSVTHAQAMALAQRPDAVHTFEKNEKSNRLLYTDDAGDKHEVWFEDVRSFEAKLDLIIDKRLAGFASWRLGQEDPEVWDFVGTLQTPATRVPPTTSNNQRWYFAETGHTLSLGFLEYWQKNGGLERFGYPRTEEFSEFDPMVGQTYTVQYFERARFEYHPEFAGTEFAVLLGHAGRWALEQRGSQADHQPVAPKPGQRYFPETGHNLGGVFLRYWESNGGLMTHGYPVTEEFRELNPEDGKTYTVQYFERARFEYHPEYAGTRHEVLLGLLGNEMLRDRGWIR